MSVSTLSGGEVVNYHEVGQFDNSKYEETPNGSLLDAVALGGQIISIDLLTVSDKLGFSA